MTHRFVRTGHTCVAAVLRRRFTVLGSCPTAAVVAALVLVCVPAVDARGDGNTRSFAALRTGLSVLSASDDGSVAGGPSNDDCTSPIRIEDGKTDFDTTGATGNELLVEDCGSGEFTDIGADIWFEYSASCSGTLTVSLCGSSYDTKLAVYAGCVECPPTDPPLECDDDEGCIPQSEVVLSVVAQDCYTIRVGGFGSAQGVGTMTITCELPPPPTAACCNNNVCTGTMTEAACTDASGTWFAGEQCPAFSCPIEPLPNDECDGALPVSSGVPVSGSTVGATGTDFTLCGMDEDGFFDDTKDVWYSWTADCDGVATFSLCGSSFDTTLAIYDACSGNELICNDDDCELTRSRLTYEVTSGTTYFIRVAGRFGLTGEYTLSVESCPDPSLGACCFTPPIGPTLCLPATSAQCANATDGVWHGAGSVCLGDIDENGVDDICKIEPFFWKDYNGVAPKGYMSDFDQNNDFDDDDADGDPTTGVDPFYNGPAAAADSLWWFDGRYPDAGVVPLGMTTMNLIQELAVRMATNGQSPSPNGHIPPYNGTWLDDTHAGIQSYLTSHGLSGLLLERTLAEPSLESVMDETLLDRNVILLLGFYRIEDALPVGGGFLVDWRRTGGHYVTVAGVNVEDGQIAICDPDGDAAEEGGEGMLRGTDHNHDNDGNPETSLPFRDVDYDHTKHTSDKGLASHDIYDATSSFTPAGSGSWILSASGDQLAYANALEPFHGEDAGGAYDLIDSSFVDNAFLADNGYPDPSVAQIYTVVESAIVVGRLGDADGDGYACSDDHAIFVDCMLGPDVTPDPTPPATAEECLAAFDADGDGDLDLFDFSVFEAQFECPAP